MPINYDQRDDDELPRQKPIQAGVRMTEAIPETNKRTAPFFPVGDRMLHKNRGIPGGE